MRRMLMAGAALAAMTTLAACQSMMSDTQVTAQAGSPEIGSWGFYMEAMDASVEPGDDFFRYVNGAWLDNFVMPADRSAYGVFTVLAERSEEQVIAIIQELAAGSPEPGSVEQQVGGFYASWMDEETVEARGLEPLRPQLDAIAAIDSEEDLMLAFADLHGMAPFGVGIIPDPADTTTYTVFVGQAGLGMPNRDYYLRDDERFADFRAAYRDYVVAVQELAGVVDAGAKADAIIALETRIAEAHWTPERSRQIEEIYNPMNRAQLAELAPEFDWNLMLDSVGLGDVDMMVVAQTTAIADAGDIYSDTSLETWKDYLTFHAINNNTQFLPAAFDEASFDFFSRTLRGQEEQRERWQRGVQLLNANLGEAVGQVYVDRHFPPENRTQMEGLVVNLRAAFAERLENLDWMDDETRAEALSKLSTFEPRVGYPSKWIDYSPLVVDDDVLANSRRSTEFQWNLQLERLGGAVDRELWAMTPQRVNAYYNPLLNQITFPAAILQPPFFDPNADAAVNYGAIGAVIGHEIGHGFDDQGSRFDETGLIRDWWTQTARARFDERSGELVEQYNGYSPIEGLNVNGELTLGENIGDLGGLQMAYAAYQRHLAENGPAPIIDGYTGDQRFFMAWAQAWRGKYRDDALRQRLVTDPHSPAEYRTNGVVRNLDAWYEAFGVTEDDALYLPPEQRVRIW